MMFKARVPAAAAAKRSGAAVGAAPRQCNSGRWRADRRRLQASESPLSVCSKDAVSSALQRVVLDGGSVTNTDGIAPLLAYFK